MPAPSAEGRQFDDTSLRLRKERLHTTMLIELLALLVFMAMAFAFVSREHEEANPLVERVERLERMLRERELQIRQLRLEVRSLRQINQQLGESLRRLLNDPRTPLRANSRLVMLPEARFNEMIADLSNQSEIIQARQQENTSLRTRLTAAGRGGAGLANCPVTSGFLVSINVTGDDGFVVTPLWGAAAGPAVARIPGARDLASGARLNRTGFRRLADRLKQWGLAQNPQCSFRARIRASHSNLNLFQQQHRVAAQYFYMAW
jgi:hypothetical protein